MTTAILAFRPFLATGNAIAERTTVRIARPGLPVRQAAAHRPLVCRWARGADGRLVCHWVPRATDDAAQPPNSAGTR